MPSATLIWLIIGTGLCLMELFLPTEFVTLMMGISAFVVALLAGVILGKLWLQVLVWLLLSAVLLVFSRRLLAPRRRSSQIQDAIIAETLTEIPPGKTGRVLYEGNSWQARCDDEKLPIAPQETVYVIRRQGTTLIVMPERLLHS
ncbi:NfeD family protein [Calothrix rhizosoleniae]|uniref:NfeD family protein n=1 Tax=Calothrix rhizosoleniae TaxID=888997 RepID=UPI000B4A4ACD|nr:NfeD family protein [Calothrix rhizosoleniae]